MVICFRCQVNISEFECEICNGFYCSECDKFIHSKKPRNTHIRKQLTILSDSTIPKNIRGGNTSKFILQGKHYFDTTVRQGHYRKITGQY